MTNLIREIMLHIIWKRLSVSHNLLKGLNMESQKKQFKHTIREAWCKGCNICVAFCPRKVLELKNGKVFAARPEDCIGCKLCELRCPDFVIDIEELDVTVRKVTDANQVDYCLPPEAHQ